MTTRWLVVSWFVCGWVCSTARHWSSAARALLVEYGDDVPDRLRLDGRQVQALTADDGRDAGRADVAQKPQ